MVAQRLPYWACAASMVSSSAGEKGLCSTLGLSWLHHLSRHDLPDLPFMYRLIKDQFLAPYRSTSRVRIRSSSVLHGPLIRSGLFPFLGTLLFPEDSEDDESDDDVVEDVHLL
uniref:Uncharacterized protein n=1 Tax=Cannabis sativa TaxID=3483 RepID=A0A803QW97_CANSA